MGQNRTGSSHRSTFHIYTPVSSISKDLQKQDFCHCLSLAFHLTSRRKFSKALNRFHIYTCNFHTHIFSQLRRKKRVQTTALREAARGFKTACRDTAPLVDRAASNTGPSVTFWNVFTSDPLTPNFFVTQSVL